MTAPVATPPLPSDNPTDALGSPAGVPYSWVTEITEFIFSAEAHDIHIETDPESGELGRAAAVYYSHDSCYMNDPGECWLPPASPSGNEPYVTGHIDYGADVGRVLVGSIPIFGGHTDTSLLFAEAVAYRNDLPERQRIVGSLFDLILPYDPDHLDEAIDDPERAFETGIARQAGVFLGAGTPEITVGEALTVNRSGLSGEWWPRRNFIATTGEHVDIALDALGPVLVTRAAIPANRQGQAAAAGAHLPLAQNYVRTASGPILGPRILPAKVPLMARTASPSWNGQPIAAAAPTIDKSTRPVIHAPGATTATAEPVTACGGSCSNTEAPCGPCSNRNVTQPEEETEDTTTEENALLARLEGEVARATAPTIDRLEDRREPATAALTGMSNKEKSSLLREAAREIFGPIFEGFAEVERVSGVYVFDYDETDVIVNVDIEDDTGWHETYWQVAYSIDGTSVTFTGPAEEQTRVTEYQPTGETIEV